MVDTTTIIDALARNLSDALGTITGAAVRAMPAVGDTAVDWQVSVQAGGHAAGTACVGLTQAGATQLVAAILGDPSLVADADIVDTLRELVGQAAAAYVNGEGKGLTLDVEPPVAATDPVPSDARAYDLIVGTGEPIRLVGWGRVVAGLADAPARPVAPAPAPVATAAVPGDPLPPPRNLDVVLDIELPITVRFGMTEMSLESLARLGPGSMIDLDRSPDDPVEVLVNGRLVARGQVVVVSGFYSVRVSDVVSPADRLRSLEL